MYDEYDSVRFFERFFLSPDFLGFFSDFLAGVFLAGGIGTSIGWGGGVRAEIFGWGTGKRRWQLGAPPTRRRPPARRRRRAARGQSAGTAPTDGLRHAYDRRTPARNEAIGAARRCQRCR